MVDAMRDSRLFDANRIITIADDRRTQGEIGAELRSNGGGDHDRSAQCHVAFVVSGEDTGDYSGPEIAQIARQSLGERALVIGVTTASECTAGVRSLWSAADAVIDIPDSRSDVSGRAFGEIYSALTGGILRPNLVGLDIEDIRTVVTRAPRISVGWGEASGEGAGSLALEEAIRHPLLGTATMAIAKSIHIAIAVPEHRANFGQLREVMHRCRKFHLHEDATKTFSLDEHLLGNSFVRVTLVVATEDCRVGVH